MKIEVVRVANVKRGTRAYCIGHLYIDGVYLCDTCEDLDRGLDNSMTEQQIYAVKFPNRGKCAIPIGTYPVYLNQQSPKFSNKKKYPIYWEVCKGYMPRLGLVKCYQGILLHYGKDETWSEGCILVGYNKKVGELVKYHEAFKKLYSTLKNAKDKITITITRKYII